VYFKLETMTELLGKFFGKDKHGSGSSQNKDKSGTTGSTSGNAGSAGAGGQAGDRSSASGPAVAQQQQLQQQPQQMMLASSSSLRGPMLPQVRNPSEFSKCTAVVLRALYDRPDCKGNWRRGGLGLLSR
jgi:hypothetical protein